MIMQKITPCIDHNKELKRLNTQLNKETNKNLIKSNSTFNLTFYIVPYVFFWSLANLKKITYLMHEDRVMREDMDNIELD